MSGEALLNNRYRLVAQQGSGGMAVIYKAIDESLGRTVAVKVLRPSLTTDPTFIARFQNEARSIANLQHPNIVTVHDVGNDGPTYFIVMEFVEGQDLKKVIRTHGALSIDRALNLSIQICAGLGYAHRARLVHADVKPQNILLTRDEVVKITDFGIAQALSDTQPAQRQSVVWGSPHYMPPEQAQGEKPSAASDVYAIGIVMFEMLTGRLPYIGADQKELALAHIREPVPLVTELNPAVPESLARIVYKVMSKEPRDRYSMADQLMNVLNTYRDQSRRGDVSVRQPAPAPPAGTPPPPSASLPQQQQDKPLVIPPSPSQQSQPGQNPAALPTQKYDPAPHAPPSSNYPRPPRVPATMSDSRPMQTMASGVQRVPADNNPYNSRQFTAPQTAEDGNASSPDVVTWILAILAFMAVACLCPLWIAVIQARM